MLCRLSYAHFNQEELQDNIVWFKVNRLFHIFKLQLLAHKLEYIATQTWLRLNFFWELFVLFNMCGRWCLKHHFVFLKWWIFPEVFIFPPAFDFTWFFYISGRSELNNILKEREERVKRVRQEQEAERLKKADEWKQQVSICLDYISDYLA